LRPKNFQRNIRRRNENSFETLVQYNVDHRPGACVFFQT